VHDAFGDGGGEGRARRRGQILKHPANGRAHIEVVLGAQLVELGARDLAADTTVHGATTTHPGAGHAFGGGTVALNRRRSG
jgi:hypothetical protein